MTRSLAICATLLVLLAAPAAAQCTQTLLYNNSFESGSGLGDWTRGAFVFNGNVVDWRGIQACTASSGTHVFRFGGGFSCTDTYSAGDFNFAQPGGTGGISIPAGATHARLTFAHRRNFETGYDGGALAISVDGTNYFLLPASVILDGTTYNGTIGNACPPSPEAGGASVFTGRSTVFTTTTVNLDAACNIASGTGTGCQGRSVRIAFVSITDCSNNYTGWFLDDVSVKACLS